LCKGPYGLYLQLGEPTEEQKKPRRASLPKDVPLDEVDFALAQRLLALPREVGAHPQDSAMIYAGIGRYGPYLQYSGRYHKLESTYDVLTIGLNLAVTKIAEAPEKGPGRGAAKALHNLGEHPDGGEVAIMDGRYGPYVKYKKINATIPKDKPPEEVTLEEALAMIEAKAAKKGGKKKAAAKKKAAPKKKAAAKKKKPAKKATAKKAAGEKETDTAAGDASIEAD
jgi:DNA topoisomerase-1